MALQKPKTLPNGATGDYWMLDRIEFDKKSMKVSCRLTLYFSKEIADGNGPSLGLSYGFSFPATSAVLSGDLRAWLYTQIKNKMMTPKPKISPDTPSQAWDDLAGATDC
jgi:hypothetical protein